MTHAVAIDVGGSKISAARVDSTGTVRDRLQVATPAGRTEQLDEIASLVTRLTSDATAAVSLAIAATLDSSGNPEWCANLSLAGTNILSYLRALVEIPVVIVNDAAAAGYAEAKLGAALNADLAVALTFGTGIGGAVICKGNLVLGLGHAGEFGHMVIDPSGPLCPCGRRGCWEQLASGGALDRASQRLAKAGSQRRAGERVIEAARCGDPDSVRAWHNHVNQMRAGLANIGAILDPDVIVIGGGLARLGGFLIDALHTAPQSPRTPRWLQADVRIARFSSDAGLVGAGVYALEMCG